MALIWSIGHHTQATNFLARRIHVATYISAGTKESITWTDKLIDRIVKFYYRAYINFRKDL